MSKRRSAPRLVPKDPRELERAEAMQQALRGAQQVAKSARGPAARPRQRSVFQ